MGADRGDIARVLSLMVPGKAGTVKPIVKHKTEDGVMECYGTVVPAEGTADYAIGGLFTKTDADVLFTGDVKSGDATSLIDIVIASTYDTDKELVGMFVIDLNKKIMGLITVYTAATGDITVADWTNYAGTAVDNAIFPARGDVYKILKLSTPEGLSVNVGDQIQDCKFKSLISTDVTKFVSVDQHVGPSAELWKDCPLLEMMIDPGVGYYYFDDFTGVGAAPGSAASNTTQGWTFTRVTAGTMGTILGHGGELHLVADTTADRGVNVQLLNCCVIPTAGKTIWFEARVQISHVDNQIFVGIAETNTVLIASGALDEAGADASSIGFFTDEPSATGVGGTVTQKNGTSDVTEDNFILAATTWYNLGFKVTGITKVEFYQDGKLIETGETANTIADAVEMALSFVCQNEDGANTNTLKVDWVRIAQLR